MFQSSLTNKIVVEPELHIDMDLYSFFAVTGTEASLRSLHRMVKDNNEARELYLEEGIVLDRSLNVRAIAQM